MTRIGLVVLLSLCGTSATALSCAAPDLSADFAWAEASPDRYAVISGTLRFDDARMPVAGGRTPPRETRIVAQFDGHGLTAQGFTTPMRMPVTLVAQCFGPWCGALDSGTDVLAFARQDASGYEIALSPCPGIVWPEPNAALEARAQACLVSGCDPDRRRPAR